MQRTNRWRRQCVCRERERKRERKEVGFRSGTFTGKWKTRFDHFIWPSCSFFFLKLQLKCLVLLCDLPLWQAAIPSQKDKKTTKNPPTNVGAFCYQFKFSCFRCSVTFLFVQPCKREPIKLLALLAVNNFMVNDAMMNGFHVAGSCPRTPHRDKER